MLENGGRIVDAEGREVLLRGVNVNALAEYWQYGEFPTVFPFGEADADQMAAIGWNTVRLLLSWSRVEPAPGQYDDAYLEQVRAAVRLLASRGLYTILDLHQDAWGPTLAAPPNDDVCTARPSRPSAGTAPRDGPRSTAARRAARRPASASSARRCSRRSPPSSPTPPTAPASASAPATSPCSATWRASSPPRRASPATIS